MKSRKQYFADYYQRNKKRMNTQTKKWIHDHPEWKRKANMRYRENKKRKQRIINDWIYGCKW